MNYYCFYFSEYLSDSFTGILCSFSLLKIWMLIEEQSNCILLVGDNIYGMSAE